MKERKIRQTLIAPKVRLLLWIHLHGVKDDSHYLAKLARVVDYSEGSIKSQFIPDLLEKKLIESLNSDKVNPPYRTTSEAKKLLEPIFLVRAIGFAFAIFIFTMLAALFLWYIDKPMFLLYWWLPLMLAGISILIFILILYPHVLLKLGKAPFPSSG